MFTSDGPRILLRSSWQVLNIGDIAHTPGLLTLIEKHIPGAETVLWASADLSDAVIAMEHKRFPHLRIVKGKIGEDAQCTTPELAAAIAGADFLLHGSGPSLLAYDDVAAFARHTGKPYGVYGITYGWYDGHDRAVYDNADFLFIRDSVSLAHARDKGVRCPVMQFAPDGAFAADLRDDDRANAFLRENALEKGKFLCCIPRNRITPYWLPEMSNRPMTANDSRAADENERFREQDHAPLRAAIEAVVERTDMKVLVCAESADQVALGKTAIFDRLPQHAKERVVWRDHFWLTDEALSTYLQSAGVFGHEMHSPIMCVGNGIPAIVCRWERQTSKGFMWRDIGLGEWLFDMDDPASVAGITGAVCGLVEDADIARSKVEAARATVGILQCQTMKIVHDAVWSAWQRSPRAK